MTDPRGYRASRIGVPAEPLLDGAEYDYADAFELRVDQPDTHSAQEWVRAAMVEAPAPLRHLIRFVHARIIRFRLGSGPDHVLGWQVASMTTDALHLQTAGPLMRAHIVARRTSPTTAVASTYLFYERPIMRLLWLVVGPVHRRVAPYLLERAAASLTTGPVAPTADRGR